jgi:hypothetical protein
VAGSAVAPGLPSRWRTPELRRRRGIARAPSGFTRSTWRGFAYDGLRASSPPRWRRSWLCAVARPRGPRLQTSNAVGFQSIRVTLPALVVSPRPQEWMIASIRVDERLARSLLTTWGWPPSPPPSARHVPAPGRVRLGRSRIVHPTTTSRRHGPVRPQRPPSSPPHPPPHARSLEAVHSRRPVSAHHRRNSACFPGLRSGRPCR